MGELIMSMFRAQSECKLDEKRRITIPTEFRRNVPPEAEETFVITRGTRGCLYAYPLDEWRKIEDRFEQIPENLENSELKSYLNEFMKVSTYDGQGRIGLSQKLIEMARLNKDVLLIGVGKKIEIWDPQVRENARKKADNRDEVEKKMDETYFQAINMARNLNQGE